MVTRTWKVYGTEGHRQRESFFRPISMISLMSRTEPYHRGRQFRQDGNDMTIYCRITRDTAKLCAAELNGQISDGIFENSRVGQILEVLP